MGTRLICHNDTGNVKNNQLLIVLHIYVITLASIKILAVRMLGVIGIHMLENFAKISCYTILCKSCTISTMLRLVALHYHSQ